jgi:hypothetical protein
MNQSASTQQEQSKTEQFNLRRLEETAMSKEKNKSISPLSRRNFIRLGALAGAAAPSITVSAPAQELELELEWDSHSAQRQHRHCRPGWSGRGGLTRNPYALDRTPCGSSSGSAAAVSVNFCAAALSTETDGSIVCPATANGVIGLKPTLRLTSRAGVVPIAHSQDTAGIHARMVADAAIVLGG